MKSREHHAVCLLLFVAIPTAVTHTYTVVDTTPPETSIDVDPGAVTNDTTPTFEFSSSEAGSSFECSVDGGAWQPCDSPLTVSPPPLGLGEGAHTFAVVATDAAGNADPTAAEHAFTVDTIPPQIVIDSPADGQTIPFGTAASAQYTCIDPGGSGVASCAGTLADGAPLDTSTAGLQEFTVDATDEAGNTAQATSSWTVAYAFDGFFSPVNNLPTVNKAKAGRAIPVKFSLGLDAGLDIMAEGYPKVVSVSCDPSVPLGEVEEGLADSNSGLTYDASADQYNYVWKTNSAWSGQCRDFVVKLDDGTEHRASFKFK